MDSNLRKLLAELPPEHTCKDARSISQCYADNRKHAAMVFSRNVDSVLDYYYNQYCTRTWGNQFVDRLTDYPDMTIRDFFEMAACDDDEEDEDDE